MTSDLLFFAANRRSRYNVTTITTITGWCGVDSLIAHWVTRGYEQNVSPQADETAVMVVTVVMVYPDLRLRTKNKNARLWADPVTVVTVYPDLSTTTKNRRSRRREVRAAKRERNPPSYSWLGSATG